MREPTQFTQFGTGASGQRRRIGQQRVVERIGAVEFEQTQTGEAQMHAVDGPVMQTSNTKRASVADTLGEQLPCVTGVLLIGPRHFGHVAEVIRFLQTDAVGSGADPQIRMESLGHENLRTPEWRRR